MKNAQKIIFASICFSMVFIVGEAFGQGTFPLTLPLFQNDNASCQDENAVDESYTATCGNFTAEDPAFADCVATTEDRPEASSGPVVAPLLSYFENQNLHDASSCGSQFAAGVQTDITVPGNTFDNRHLGSVIHADFSGSEFEDVLYPVSTDEIVHPSVLELLPSDAGGGFPTAVSQGVLPSLEIGLAVGAEDPVDDISPFRTDYWPRDAGTIFQACDRFIGNFNVAPCAADKSLVPVDCNADGAPDSVTAIAVGTPTAPSTSIVNLRTHVNSGSGLIVPPLDEPVTQLTSGVDDDPVAASVARGDFGGAGDDVVVAVFSLIPPNLSEVVICQNDGACGYTCQTPISLQAIVGADFTRPFSVAAGDFNGDGFDDAVISLAGADNGGALLSSLLYLFGDGAGSLSNPLLVSSVTDGSGSALLNVNGADYIDMVPTSLTTGQFDNDGILDVAVTNFHGPVAASPTAPQTPFSQPLPQGDVVVFSSNATSGAGFSPLPTALHFPTQEVFNGNGVSLGTFSADRASGLASADFDHCGGDDVFALAEICLGGAAGGNPILDLVTGNCLTQVQRIASVFLNANEPPVVDAGPDLDANANEPVDIVAICQDPTGDDRTYTWTVTGSPAGSTGQFTPESGALVDPETSASTSFQADLPGVYTLELSCLDFCGLEAQDSLTVTVADTPLLTQGGCIASLTPGAAQSWSTLFWLLGLAPILYRRLRA